MPILITSDTWDGVVQCARFGKCADCGEPVEGLLLADDRRVTPVCTRCGRAEV